MHFCCFLLRKINFWLSSVYVYLTQYIQGFLHLYGEEYSTLPTSVNSYISRNEAPTINKLSSVERGR